MISINLFKLNTGMATDKKDRRCFTDSKISYGSTIIADNHSVNKRDFRLP